MSKKSISESATSPTSRRASSPTTRRVSSPTNSSSYISSSKQLKLFNLLYNGKRLGVYQKKITEFEDNFIYDNETTFTVISDKVICLCNGKFLNYSGSTPVFDDNESTTIDYLKKLKIKIKTHTNEVYFMIDKINELNDERIDHEYKNNMIKKYINNNNSRNNPIAFLTLGSSGSGKSSSIKKLIETGKIPNLDYVNIDYDEFASNHPLFKRNHKNKKYDILSYHKIYSQVSHIVEKIYSKCLEYKIPMIIHSIKPSENRMINLQNNGYTFYLFHKQLDDLEEISKRRYNRLQTSYLFTKLEFVTDKDIKNTYASLEKYKPNYVDVILL